MFARKTCQRIRWWNKGAHKENVSARAVIKSLRDTTIYIQIIKSRQKIIRVNKNKKDRPYILDLMKRYARYASTRTQWWSTRSAGILWYAVSAILPAEACINYCKSSSILTLS